MNRYTISVDKIRHNGDGKTRFESIRYPEFDPKTTDYYIITKRMDRMDLIAYDWYQDATLWWVIQRANYKLTLSAGSGKTSPTGILMDMDIDDAISKLNSFGLNDIDSSNPNDMEPSKSSDVSPHQIRS